MALISSDAFTARQTFNILNRIQYGSLAFTTPDGKCHHFKGKEKGPSVAMHIQDWSVPRRALLRGDIGFGEDYIEGKWSTPDLPALMHFFVLNLDEVEKFCHGTWWQKILFKLLAALRSNHKRGSKKNIKAHYDVGNEFYKLWLDQSMTYSSALFESRDISLEDAQKSKYERILSKLGTSSQLLEIGGGWGGFAEMAAKAGHHIKSITVSKAQYEFAKNRLKKADNAQVLLKDYRDVKGGFDSIVSIEMFEAVGERYWPTYFKTIRQRLREGGKAVIQTITIDDKEFDAYRSRSDFIRHYTFPGGMLPSLQRFREEAEKVGLKFKEAYAFGQDYARTLQEWLNRFEAKKAKILDMGYSEQFIRSWVFYLSLCIGSFLAGRTDVMQIELVRE